MPESKLRCTEIPLRDFDEGFVWIEPAGDPLRSMIQVQFQLPELRLYSMSPEEAYVVGSNLVDHALECGYDPKTGETKGE